VSDCPVCGGTVPEGRRHVYCGPRCRKVAERQRLRARRVAEFTEAASGIEPSRDRAEVLQLLMVAARLGSVSAAKILLDELRRDGPALAPTDFIDEVTRRRHGR
jgi:hypothetical protein